MPYETLLYDKQGQLAHVTLNRPRVLNTRNRQMRLEIVDLVAAIDADPDVRAVIITGAGEKAFCFVTCCDRMRLDVTVRAVGRRSTGI